MRTYGVWPLHFSRQQHSNIALSETRKIVVRMIGVTAFVAYSCLGINGTTTCRRRHGYRLVWPVKGSGRERRAASGSLARAFPTPAACALAHARPRYLTQLSSFFLTGTAAQAVALAIVLYDFIVHWGKRVPYSGTCAAVTVSSGGRKPNFSSWQSQPGRHYANQGHSPAGRVPYSNAYTTDRPTVHVEVLYCTWKFYIALKAEPPCVLFAQGRGRGGL